MKTVPKGREYVLVPVGFILREVRHHPFRLSPHPLRPFHFRRAMSSFFPSVIDSRVTDGPGPGPGVVFGRVNSGRWLLYVQ